MTHERRISHNDPLEPPTDSFEAPADPLKALTSNDPLEATIDQLDPPTDPLEDPNGPLEPPTDLLEAQLTHWRLLLPT